MSLELLSDTQRDFVNKHIHGIKKIRKKALAKSYGTSRQRMDRLMSALPPTLNGYADLVERQKKVEALADEGHFGQAGRDAEALIFDLEKGLNDSAEYLQKEWENIKFKFQTISSSMSRFETWRDTQYLPMFDELKNFGQETVPQLEGDDYEDWNRRVTEFAERLEPALKTQTTVIGKIRNSLKDGLKGIPILSFTKALPTFRKFKFSLEQGLIKPPSGDYKTVCKPILEEIKRNPFPENLRGNAEEGCYSDLDFDLLIDWTKKARGGVDWREIQVQKLRDALGKAKWELRHLGEDVENQFLNEEIQQDRNIAQGQTGPTKDRQVRKEANFDSSEFLGKLSDSVLPPGSYNLQSKEMKELINESKTLFSNYLNEKNLSKESDEFFDLMLKGVNNFTMEYAIKRGWAKAGTIELPKDLAPEKKATAEAFGRGMHQAIMERQANKVSFKKASKSEQSNEEDEKEENQEIESITIGGKEYIEGKVIGQGGFGKVMQFVEKGNPEKTIVGKMMITSSNEQRDFLIKEIKNHRHLMKGDEKGKGRENIVDLQGAVQTPGGSLMMIMEPVAGGDLDNNRFGLEIATNSGVLSEEARTILNQKRFKQAVEGMMYLRENSMVHFDIKGANILIAEDGTVKIADFGSSAVSDNPEGIVRPDKSNAITKGFTPDDLNTLETDKWDIFALGRLAQVMQMNFSTAKVGPGERAVKEDSKNSLGRMVEAMTQDDPNKRISLEGVLQSSYVKNVDNYSEEDVEELSKLTIQYSKAVKKESKAILENAFDKEEQEELKVFLKVPFDKVDHLDILRNIKNYPDPVSDNFRQQYEEHLKKGHLSEEKANDFKNAWEQYARKIELYRRFEAELGKSDEAKKIGEQIKDVSFRLTHPGIEPNDVDGLKHFLKTLESCVDAPAQFIRFISLPSSREFLRFCDVDPVALNKAASFYYMQEEDKEKARLDLSAAKDVIEHFLSSVKDEELQDFFREALFTAHEEVESSVNTRN